MLPEDGGSMDLRNDLKYHRRESLKTRKVIIIQFNDPLLLPDHTFTLFCALFPLRKITQVKPPPVAPSPCL